MIIKADNKKWWLLGAMGIALGVFTLDETVVGVALPTMKRDLGLSTIESHWVVNIYLLVLSCLVAASGKVCDIVGFKRIFIGGFLLFGATSIACGLAHNDVSMLAARAAQGVGAAMIFPASMAMLSIIFPEEERGQAFGIYGAVGCIFLASGPFVGGLLTEFASWRWIFWINPPIVLAAAGVVWLFWEDPPRPPERAPFDGGGLFNLVGGLTLTIFGIMQGPDLGWGSPTVWGTLLAGLAALA
ncbi:MAG: MFS transporter, partial [Pseudomonadota bacterium]